MKGRLKSLVSSSIFIWSVVIVISTVVLLLMQGCASTEISPTPETSFYKAIMVYPTDDANVATVQEGVGRSPMLLMGLWEGIKYPDSQSIIYLKFDLSAIPADAKIAKAYLTIYGQKMAGMVAGSIVSVDDDGWSEDTVTWQNAPAMTDSLWSGTFSDGWNSLNVTNFVKAQLAKDKIASFASWIDKELGYTQDYNSLIAFFSKDHQYKHLHPRLEINIEIEESGR